MKVLKATDNPLKSIPKEVIVNDQLIPYLRNLHKGSKLCYRMKLMFVGGGNVGKTTLLKTLKRIKQGKTINFITNISHLSPYFLENK